MKKYAAEFVGTLTLVLFGCGAAVVAHRMAGPLDRIGIVGIAFAFGLALIAMAYGIGPISGCHINPAVSLGAFTAGRMTGKDLAGYVVAQILGGVAGAAVLYAIAAGSGESFKVAEGFGTNGWGAGSIGGFSLLSAATFELVATFIFVVVILGSTQPKAPAEMAGLAIGLTLVVIHIFGIRITGVSVNPARSLGPALFEGGRALAQVWMFLVAPTVGGLLAGVLFRFKALEK